MSDTGSKDTGKDTQPSEKEDRSTKACHSCGTWTCGRCGNVQKTVSLRDTHSCTSCGYDQGSVQASRHTRKTWDDHNTELKWDEAPA